MQVSSSTRNYASFLFLALSVCLLSGCLIRRVDGVIESIERNQIGVLTIKSHSDDGRMIRATVIGDDTDLRIMCYCQIGVHVTFNSPSALSIRANELRFDVTAANVACNQQPK